MYVRRWVSWTRAGLGVDRGNGKATTQLESRIAVLLERRIVRRQPSVSVVDTGRQNGLSVFQSIRATLDGNAIFMTA